MTRLLDKPTFNKNDNSRPASSKNDNNKPVFRKNNSKVSFSGDGVEYAKKPEKLKDQKLAKSQKLSKLKQLKSEKILKNKNSQNFDITEAKPYFLIPNNRIAFNYLWLAFTKPLIFYYFNLKYYIWIKFDVLGYTIIGVLNQLTSKTSLDKVVTKINLGQ